MMDKDNPKKRQELFLTIGGKKKTKVVTQEWKKGETESAAAIEPKKNEDEFQWLLPEETERKEDVLTQYVPVQKAAAKRATGRIFIVVISAVLVGVLLGYSLVKIVTQQKEGAAPPAILKEEKAKQEREVAAPVAPAAPKTEKTALLPLEMAVVQGGVFSTKEAADSVKQQVKDLGLPAESVRQNGQYFVLLAAASTVETAKAVGGLYQTAGADTYAKQVSISPAQGLSEEAGEMAVLFSIAAEESGKTAAGLSADKSKLEEAEKKLETVKVPSSDEASAKLKQLLTEALTEAKSDQPQAAKAAQEKLLAFLAVYSE
ncbi:hypothetical protein AC623_13970 [Bacillus sp. FJAT-27231]|uniref:hypothetical protein n=1 Tax=Bacillus sp. FJAT-27231 TaxID=1679168 RepID=UPI0006711AC1|nr:hypothetical protein [Bacillus sp. FJAT-27231]KMY54905.1 hypothetical protein AC623_13970 [Bacillus sp. FJAT-27231]